MDPQIEQLTHILRHTKRGVFFGGAGVSTASGIPDFRSSNGLFSQRLSRQFTPEQLVSHTFFQQYPEDFYAFYKDKLLYPDVAPNACHRALATLERMSILRAVVTQNIDGLHQAAGSRCVYELHGSVLRNYCTGCHRFYTMQDILDAPGIPRCKDCGSIIKPDVVLYEEGLDDEVVSGAIRAIAEADTLIVGGTSLVVYPAAGLLRYFQGDHLVLINKSSTQADARADLLIHDDIATVLDRAVQNL